MPSDEEKMRFGRDVFDASQPARESSWKARAEKAEARVAELETGACARDHLANCRTAEDAISAKEIAQHQRDEALAALESAAHGQEVDAGFKTYEELATELAGEKARVAELEALMHFDARRPDGRGVGPEDIKAYLNETEAEWLTVVQQVRGRLMTFEHFQERAEQAEARVSELEAIRAESVRLLGAEPERCDALRTLVEWKVRECNELRGRAEKAEAEVAYIHEERAALAAYLHEKLGDAGTEEGLLAGIDLMWSQRNSAMEAWTKLHALDQRNPESRFLQSIVLAFVDLARLAGCTSEDLEACRRAIHDALVERKDLQRRLAEVKP